MADRTHLAGTDRIIYDEVISKTECPHCKFLFDTFLADLKCTYREYYLMTEVFVYLHGGDVCNWSDTPSITVAQD